MRLEPFVFDANEYPTRPGCYLMRDRTGRVIYVGKAKNLRDRLSSYFRPKLENARRRRLVSRIRDIEVIIVNSESESLVLENNLIKQYKPVYNRQLKRDRTGYAYIVLTGEEFPRFVIYKKLHYNRDLEGLKESRPRRRFGPYPGTRYRDMLLDFVIENYGIRICKPLRSEVCLRYHLGRCSGICERRISPEQYAESVAQAVALLSCRQSDVLERMRERMAECASKLEFERAQKIKEQIQALEATLERQIVERDIDIDQDIVYFGDEKALVTHVESGMIRNLRIYGLPKAAGHGRESNKDEGCLATDGHCEQSGQRHEQTGRRCEPAGQHYVTGCPSALSLEPEGADPRLQFLLDHFSRSCPDEIILNGISDPKSAARMLSERAGRAVKITQPKRGVKWQLLELCRANYEYRVLGIV